MSKLEPITMQMGATRQGSHAVLPPVSDVGGCAGGVASASIASAARPDDARPIEVPGPLGRPMTLADLPPPDTRRWVVRRKAEVIAAIRGGLLTAAEACARYRLSPEELELWQDSIERAGVPGLRVTRIQLYRDYPVKKPAPRPAEHDGRHSVDLSRAWSF
jgi:hypothetical protein